MNETVKFLMEYKYKVKEFRRQVTTTLQAQVKTFQLPESTEVTTRPEYILLIRDTQQVSTPAMQPSPIAAPKPQTVIANVQPQRSSLASSQPATFLVVDDQQPGPSRQVMFALSPTKNFNPPSVTSGQQDLGRQSTQHFWIIKSFSEVFICAAVPADRHITTIFSLSTSTNTVNSVNYHSARKARPPSQSSQQNQRNQCISLH